MTSPDPTFWYLAQTKPRQEDIALANLERQGFLVNLPKIARIKPSARLSATEVLFPGYIFFAPYSQAQSIAPVRSTLGVSRLVRFGQSVATLSSDLLEEMLGFIAQKSSAPGGLAAHIKGIVGGTRVEITEGPFAGLEGLVSAVAKDRVMVLLEIMGKPQCLQFAHRALSAC